MVRVTIAIIVCMLSTGPALAQEFTVGLWKGKAYYYKENGEFSHCAITAEYQSGDSLILSITAQGEIVLGVSNPRWQLREGSEYPVWLSIDRRELGKHQAIANLETAAFVFLPYSDDLIRLLRKGQVLTMETRSDSLVYRLTGTNAALPRVQDCVYRKLFANQVSKNPFSSETNPFSGNRRGGGTSNPFGAGRPDRQLEEKPDAETVELILEEAGLEGYKFVPAAARPEYMSDAVYVWTNGEVIGALYAYDMSEFGLGLATSIILSGYEEACDGSFTSGARTEKFSDGSSARRVLAECTGSAEKLLMTFLVFEVETTLAAVVHIAPERYGAALGEADAGIFRVFGGT